MEQASASGSGHFETGNTQESAFLVEGVGDEVIHALTVIACFAIPACIWMWQNRRHIFPGIHPAQLGIVQEVRRRMGFADAGDADGQAANPNQVRTLDPAGVPQPAPNIPRYQLDNTCPVCFGICRYAVLTNCGHRFCTNCIVTYWRVGRWIGDAVECPVCRVRVTLLLPDFTSGGGAADAGADPQAEVQAHNEAVAEIREYNRRFSGVPRSFMDYVRDAPVLLRHLWQRMFSVGGLMLIFRLRILLCFAAMFLYVLSPLDILPEAVFGLLGIMDDLFIVGMALFYVVTLYRHYLGQGNVFD